MTHHLLVLEVDLNPTTERLVFTGYGHVGNSLERIRRNELVNLQYYEMALLHLSRE
jgi:hypothetical protein